MTYKKTILKNGLRVITVPMKDNPTVTVLVLVEAGSKYENKKNNGISHFLEHMCFKGTKNRPHSSDISTELDTIGAHYNAFTGEESTCYYVKSDYRHLNKALDIVSDMYLNATLPSKEIEKEKGVIIEEINMYEDLPQRKVQMVLAELLYGDQPAGWSIAGSKDNIKQMQSKDFLAYRDKFYVPKATTVVVAGNFAEAKVLKDISKIFGSLITKPKGQKIKTKEKQDKPQIKIFKKDTDQTHLILAVRTFNTYDKREVALEVLEGVLSGGMSSRLFRKMRDELGLCYYISTSADLTTDNGIFMVSAGVNNQKLPEAITAILVELRKMKTDLVTTEELKKVKQHLLGHLYLGLETSDSLAEFFGGQEIMNKKIKTPEEIKAEIESVTTEDIRELAREIFVNKGLNLALVGRFEDKAEFTDILNF